jgi:hypothetical protein
LNNAWVEGRLIKGFYCFKRQNQYYYYDLGVYLYSQRKKLFLNLQLIEIADNLWFSPCVQ